MRELRLLQHLNRSYRQLGLNRVRLFVALLLMLITSLLEMAGLSVMYPLVLALSSEQSSLTDNFVFRPFPALIAADVRTQVIVLLASVAVLYVAKNVTLYFTYQYNINFAMYYYRRLIRALYHAYIRKDILEFRKDSAGAIANIVCVQSGRLVDGVVRPLLVVVTELCLLTGTVALVCFIAPGLIVLVVVACGGAGAIYYWTLRGTALRWGKRRMVAASVLQELVGHTADGISEIKVFGKEEYLTDRVYDAAVTETEMFRNLEMYQQGPRLLIESVFVTTFVLTFALSLLADAPVPTVLAQFSLIAAASFRLLPCLNRLVSSYSSFSFNLGPALDLMHTIAADRLIEDRRTAAGVERHRSVRRGPIRLENVSFTYPGADRPVLDHVDLRIDEGERVGIVGASGSGKSTLIELLGALYFPTGGLIAVGDTSLAVDPTGWQQTIGYVPQVPFIMPGTIRENVAFESERDIKDVEVWRALDQVGLSTFARSLPTGLATEIGEKGQGLSGGQQQLICLARALYRKPAVLLLDEPTAALDGDNEQIVLRAIASLPRGTTIVMVSHRPEAFREFDSVYECTNGILRSASVLKPQ